MPDSEEEAIIEISPTRLLCPPHGEHLRAHWPSGYVAVFKAIFDAAMANDGLVREVDPAWDGIVGHAKLDAGRLNEITARRPFCYFASRDEIRAALIGSGVLHYGRCDVCGVPRDAGPYTTQEDEESEPVVRTVCVECALDAGEQLHATNPDGGVWPEGGE